MQDKAQHDALVWIRKLASETQAFQVLRAKPDVERPTTNGKVQWDWVVEVAATAGGGHCTFLVEARGRVTPQTALDILGRMKVEPEVGSPLLCCPVVSPRIQELCQEFAISYLDAAGNCRISAPGLFIERRGLAKVSEEKPPIDLFAPKTSRIIRAMLSEPAQGWQVQQLANWEGLGVSLGLASRVKQALMEQGYAIERDRLLYVRNPEDLLKAWTENYRPKVEQFPLYVAGDPQQSEAAIAEWCLSNNVRYALTQFSGAWRSAPAVRYQRSTIYVQGLDDESWGNLKSFGSARRVDSGANVFLWQTHDPAIFLGERSLGAPPLRTVSGLQLYLDLKQLRGRGDEAAQAVYDAEIAPQFAEVSQQSPQ